MDGLRGDNQGETQRQSCTKYAEDPNQDETRRRGCDEGRLQQILQLSLQNLCDRQARPVVR